MTCQSYEQGGLKMVNIFLFLSALKINWIKKLFDTDNQMTRFIMNLYPSLRDLRLFNSAFCNVASQSFVNLFWNDVLIHLKTFFDACKPKSFEDFVSEPLFYNSEIRRDKKVIFFQDWFENNIVSVGHLLGPQGFLTLNEFKEKLSDKTRR